MTFTFDTLTGFLNRARCATLDPKQDGYALSENDIFGRKVHRYVETFSSFFLTYLQTSLHPSVLFEEMVQNGDIRYRMVHHPSSTFFSPTDLACFDSLALHLARESSVFSEASFIHDDARYEITRTVDDLDQKTGFFRSTTQYTIDGDTHFSLDSFGQLLPSFSSSGSRNVFFK